MKRATRDLGQLNRILVVVSEDVIDREQPEKSPLIKRALELAHTYGCELELFDVCCESPLSWPYTVDELGVSSNSDDRLPSLQRRAAMLAELALRLKSQVPSIRHDVVWAESREQGIIRKALESHADLVLKQSRDHRFWVGISSNTDWALIRQCPVPVWFVKDAEHTPIRTIVAAIGSGKADQGGIEAQDVEVLATAKALSAPPSKSLWAAHSYAAPHEVLAHAGMAHTLQPADGVALMEANRKVRDERLQEHAQSVRALATRFDLPLERMVLIEGHPAQVLPPVVKDKGADLLVLGARERSYWNRLFADVTAEPVLQRAPCDVLVVRSNPDLKRDMVSLRPALHGQDPDLEQALSNPGSAFAKPSQVLSENHLSRHLRRRILLAWRRQLLARLQQEDREDRKHKSGTVHPAEDPGYLLKQIDAALTELEENPSLSVA